MRKLIACAVPFLVCGVLVAPLTGQQTAERSRTQGIKETDRFVKAGGGTTQSVVNAKLQIQKTLDAYNALVTQPSKDMKGDYKRLMKSSDSMNDRLTEARQKLDEMKQAGTTYFNGRAETIKGIQDQELRSRAEQRLTDSQKQFADVIQSLRDAGAPLEPFRKELADQITYLGSDLTPSAMASLKPNAEKLNTRGQQIFAVVDKAVTTANAYFQGLRATES